MDNFNLKQFLVENKITTNSKMMEKNETSKENPDDVFGAFNNKWHNLQGVEYNGNFDFDYNEEEINSYDDLISKYGKKQIWFAPERSDAKKFGMVGDGRKMFNFYKDKYGPFIIRKRKSIGEIKAVPGNTGIKNALDFTFEEAKGKMVFIEIDEDGDDSKEYMQIDTLDDYNSLKNVITSYSKSGILSDYYIN